MSQIPARLVEVREREKLQPGEYGFTPEGLVIGCPVCGQEFVTPFDETRHYNRNTQTIGGTVRLGCGWEGFLQRGHWVPT